MQKEVEEEKQARVDQVSDLLGWVKGLQRRTGGPYAESSLAAQQVKQFTFFFYILLGGLLITLINLIFCSFRA